MNTVSPQVVETTTHLEGARLHSAFYSALRKHPGGGAGMVTEKWDRKMQTESSVCEGKEGRVITTQEKQF